MKTNPLDSIDTFYVDAQALLPLLQKYKKPWDWIARQIKNGNLIRIKNGLYCIAKREIEKSQLANVLYGPSYVSLHWALSFYGFIPERVEVVTSVTTRRNKEYSTPLGRFSYSYLNRDRYCIAFNLTEKPFPFLIATPEKAIIDFLHFYCDVSTKKDLLDQLFESYRMEIDDINNLDKRVLKAIALQYRSPIVDLFIKSLELL